MPGFPVYDIMKQNLKNCCLQDSLSGYRNSGRREYSIIEKEDDHYVQNSFQAVDLR